MLNFHVNYLNMNIISEFISKFFGYRLIPDTRVKRFNEDEAIDFLRKHGKMSYLWDDSIWNDMQNRPDDDIFRAYEDVCYEHECCPE